MRHIAVQRVQQKQRFVGTGATHMHVLAEDGELLGEVAIQHRHLKVAGFFENAPLGPVLKGMGAAATHAHVQQVTGL